VSDLVLIVEDSAEDAETVRRALRRSHPQVELEHITDGSEVVGRLTTATLPRPRLVLLDLNLVGFGGLGVLKAVRAEPSLGELPVVVLTSSTSPNDVDRCYAAGASSYLVKSIDFQLMRATVSNAVDYWLAEPA
jgi:CheY-like chemotaxis protein